MIGSCQSCQETRPSLPGEPMVLTPTPSYPFESISADLFSLRNQHYLAVVDRFSNYLHISQWNKDPTSRQVIRAFLRIFSGVGIPREVSTDGGLQFASAEMQSFFEKHGIKWRCSSPEHPESNGSAEAAVKSLKNLLKRLSTTDCGSEEFCLALLELQNTPGKGGVSPAQLVFGHGQRTGIPQTSQAMLSEVPKKGALNKKEKEREKQAQRFAGRRMLKPLSPGDLVWYKMTRRGQWIPGGRVIEFVGKRSYLIEREDGRNVRRNRMLLRLCQMTQSQKPNDDPESAPPQPRRSTRHHEKPKRYR